MQPLILIIDDDNKLREAIADTLDVFHYRIITADNSEDGLNLARKHGPDVILCDVVLPDAAGFDTVTALRANPATQDTPVVLMTGYPYVCKYEGDGKCLTLLKPFSTDTLVDVVKGALAARHHGQHAVA